MTMTMTNTETKWPLPATDLYVLPREPVYKITQAVTPCCQGPKTKVFFLLLLIVKNLFADARPSQQAAEPTCNACLDLVEGVNGGEGEDLDGERGEGGGVPNGGAWPDCQVHI